MAATITTARKRRRHSVRERRVRAIGRRCSSSLTSPRSTDGRMWVPINTSACASGTSFDWLRKRSVTGGRRRVVSWPCSVARVGPRKKSSRSSPLGLDRKKSKRSGPVRPKRLTKKERGPVHSDRTANVASGPVRSGLVQSEQPTKKRTRSGPLQLDRKKKTVRSSVQSKAGRHGSVSRVFKQASRRAESDRLDGTKKKRVRSGPTVRSFGQDPNTARRAVARGDLKNNSGPVRPISPGPNRRRGWCRGCRRDSCGSG